jgi:hypothetical protein
VSEEALAPRRYKAFDETHLALIETAVRLIADRGVDAEVYSVMLLTAALIGPRVFRNRVNPAASDAVVIERFRREQQRALKRDGLFA